MPSRAKAIANDEPASPPPTTTTSKLDAARTAASLLQHVHALQRPELEHVEAAGIDPAQDFNRACRSLDGMDYGGSAHSSKPLTGRP